MAWPERKPQKVAKICKPILPNHTYESSTVAAGRYICKCHWKWPNIQKSVHSDGFWEYPSSIAAVCGRHKARLYARCLQSKRPLLCHPGSAQPPSIYAKKDVKLTLSRPFQSGAGNSIAWLENEKWQKVKVPILFKTGLFHQHENIIPPSSGMVWSVRIPPKRLVVRRRFL